LIAIALVHSDDRLASGLASGLFAVGVAASLLLILAHDRPFIGQMSVGPNLLLQVMPDLESNQPATNQPGTNPPASAQPGTAQPGNAAPGNNP
jgi:hypothetical protein